VDILGDVVQSYNLQTTLWWTRLLPWARTVFFLLASIELAWSLVTWSSTGVDAFWSKVAGKVAALVFFYSMLLLYPQFMPNLTVGFADVGGMAQGFFNLSPTAILDQGISLALELWWGVDFLDLINPLALLFRIGPCALILIAHALLAIQVFRLLIEQYLVVGTGVFFFSFSASRWSWTLAEGLIRYGVQVGVQLFMVSILLGVGRGFATEWLDMLQQLSLVVDFRAYAHITVASLSFALVVWTVPPRAARAIAGNLTIGNPYRDAS
jgi:P-type conjugative transfer protein TrbL